MSQHTDISGESVARWGAPGTALAPWWLREIFPDRSVGSLEWDGRPVLWSELGPDWSEKLGELNPDRAVRAVRMAATGTLDSVRDLPSSTLIPTDLVLDEALFEQLEFRNRTLNVLRRQGVTSDPNSLCGITLAEALDWRNFGVFSLLDLTCCLEAAFVSDMQTDGGTTPEVKPEGWTFDIGLCDPRLKHLDLPKLNTSLGKAIETTGSRSLLEAVSVVAEIVHSISARSLISAIEDLLTAAGSLDDERLETVIRRLGLGGGKPITLDAAGSRLGLTRERIRQIVRDIERQLESVDPLFLPQLDDALAMLAIIAPCRLSEANQQLRDSGLGEMTTMGIVRAAELFRRPPTITVLQGIVLRPDDPIVESNAVRALASKAVSLARSSAASNLDYLNEAIAEEGLVIRESVLELMLDNIPDMERSDQWFWLERPGPRDKLANVTRKILAINEPQSVRSVREALRRRLTFKSIEPVPPRYVVSQMLDRHPEFVLEGDKVFAVNELSLDEVMGDLELAMVRILQSAAGGVMTRAELMEACYDQGLNMHSVGVYTSYSPCLERVSSGIWAARGASIDPARVELARERLGRPAELVRDGGWTKDGLPWFAFELTTSNYAGPVASVDASIRAVLRGRALSAYTGNGVVVGNIRVSDDGVSAWGFTKAIEVLGAEPEDVIRVEVDLVDNMATVALVAPDEFD